MPEEVGFGSTHLVVGVPAGGRLTTVHWGINLAAQIYPMNMAADYCSVSGAEVGEARNAMVEYALKANAKFIWFVDDDVLPPPYAVQRLMAALRESDAVACGGIYYSKSDVPSPVVFAAGGQGPFYDWEENQVFVIPPGGFIGTGALLIDMEVFKDLPRPWFKTLEYPDKVNDDAFFCRQVHALGQRILGHGGVLCGHYNARTGKTIWPKGSVYAPTAQPVNGSSASVLQHT